MEYLTRFQLAVDSGLFILIWLVQLIIYPSFRYISEDHFRSWHKEYTGLISLIVTPLILCQLGIEIVHLVFYTPRWYRVGLIGLVWLSTFSLSVPCHKRLQISGKNTAVIEQLVATNWLRTLLWSALFFLTMYHVPGKFE